MYFYSDVFSTSFEFQHQPIPRFVIQLAMLNRQTTNKEKDEWYKYPARKLSYILIIVGILLLVTILVSFIFNGFNQFNSLKRFLTGNSLGFIYGLTFWLGNWLIGRWTGSRLNWSRNPSRANTISLMMFIGYGILVSVSVPYLLEVMVFHNTHDSIKIQILFSAFIALTIDLLFISVYYARFLTTYWQKAIEQYEELKRDNLLARYESLKSQVNPHFLFNTLNTLSGLVEKTPDKAPEFIGKLSDIYRYVLDQSKLELVSLDEELKFTKDYFYLSKIRHGEGLSLQIETSGMKMMIPPMCIQLLVENAIKHNIVSDDKPLYIKIYVENDHLVVENNLQKKRSLTREKPLGLDNLKQRYSFFTHQPVDIEESETCFKVKLPLLISPKLESL